MNRDLSLRGILSEWVTAGEVAGSNAPSLKVRGEAS